MALTFPSVVTDLGIGAMPSARDGHDSARRETRCSADYGTKPPYLWGKAGLKHCGSRYDVRTCPIAGIPNERQTYPNKGQTEQQHL